MSIFEAARQEDILRAHIRQLLHSYAIEHLTTNYVEFTEQGVSELLSQCLHECPMTESFSVRLPEEPFHAFMRLVALDDLDPSSLSENPPVSLDVMQYLQTFLATLDPGRKFKPRSQRTADFDDYKVYTPEEQFEPILSRRAKRATPRPGANSCRTSLDTTHALLLKSSKVDVLKHVQIPAIEEPANAIELELALKVTWSLNREAASEVKTLLKATAALSRPGHTHINQFLDPNSRPDSPPLQFLLGPASLFDTGPEFVPIFSRKRMPRNGRVELFADKKQAKDSNISSKSKPHLFDKGRTDNDSVLLTLESPPHSIIQLGAQMGPVKMEEEDSDAELHKENMKIVDGWETYRSSPVKVSEPSKSGSSSPSLSTPHSSQEEVDQLNVDLSISSPNTELTPIKLLKDSRMDIPALPRSKRARMELGDSPATTNAKPRKIGGKKSFAALIFGALDHRKSLYDLTAQEPDKITTPPKRLQLPARSSVIGGDQALNSSPLTDLDDPIVLKNADARLTSTEPVADSSLGEPAVSGVDVDIDGTTVAVDGFDSFESDLYAISGFRDMQDEDPIDFAMKEKLSYPTGKELLMEVPKLLPPNEHIPNDDILFLARKMCDYVSPSGSNRLGVSSKVHQFLRKAKGMQSATLNLSWVPFAVSNPLPTDEELLGVDSVDYIDTLGAFDRMGITKEQGLARVKGTMEGLNCAREGSDTESTGSEHASSNLNLAHEHIWEEWSDRADSNNQSILGEIREDSEWWKFDTIVLSREERRRLAGLNKSKRKDDDASCTDPDINAGTDINFEDTMAAQDRKIVHAVGNANIDTQRTSTPTLPLVSLPTPLRMKGQCDVSEQESMPRTGSDFGIPYYLSSQRVESSNDIIEQGPGSIDDVHLGLDTMTSGNGDCQYPNGHEYHEYATQPEDGLDSDKENRDPSVYARVYVDHSRVPVFPQVREEEGGDYSVPGFDSASRHIQQRQHSIYSFEETGDHHRRLKRPRLDGWEWEDEDSNLLDVREQQGVDDSGIGFIPSSLSPPRRAVAVGHARGHDQNNDNARFMYGWDHNRDEAPLHMDYSNALTEVDHGIVDARNDTMSSQDQNHEFVPLCFDSQPILDNLSQPLEPVSDLWPVPALEAPPPHKTAPSDSIFHRSAGIAAFAELRARKLPTYPLAPEPPSITNTSASANQNSGPDSNSETTAYKTASESIFDRDTLRLPLPEDRSSPTSIHRYMTSMNFLQKQALVRSLRSRSCSVELIEREYIADVDLIVDPHTAIIFPNLPALPSELDLLTNAICAQSWRYETLLIIFEAFAPSIALKSNSASQTETSLNTYSSPVIKAVKKLRRDVSLAEACDDKRTGCKVLMAFAESVQEAAMFARMLGDQAEKRNEEMMGGMFWDDRKWLEGEAEDESILAGADGMNPFAARVLLCQISIDELLEIGPEERIIKFGPQVGSDRMVKLNEVIDREMQKGE